MKDKLDSSLEPEDSDLEPTDDGHGYTTQRRQGLGNAARSMSGAEGHTTMFQPGVMIDDILEQSAERSGTRVVEGEPRPPKLQLENSPYLLLVGAPPGKERLSILHARTTFGRDRGDIQLDDGSVSSLHFQIDVVGREFFVRDLGSRNGTQLNGHPVRYAEVLPGDEIRAGETVLVFRLEGDGLSTRKETGP